MAYDPGKDSGEGTEFDMFGKGVKTIPMPQPERRLEGKNE
jgi:hypothetical protein